MEQLGCPSTICPSLSGAPTTPICGAAYPFERCDAVGPVFAIENATLIGTLNGTLFEEMRGWVGLVLSNTSLSGTIPAELVRLPSLRRLYLDKNNLSGTLPEFPSSATLEDLRVNQNRLHGTIPDAYIRSLPAIKRLYFGANRFSGSLPSNGAFPVLLDTFYANDNNLTGTLPSLLEKWQTDIKWFSVASNQLSGTLPPGVFSVDGFHVFRVDDNQLTGLVPPDLDTQTDLKTLNLSFNRFEGIVMLPPVDQCLVAGNMFVLLFTVRRLGAIAAISRPSQHKSPRPLQCKTLRQIFLLDSH